PDAVQSSPGGGVLRRLWRRAFGPGARTTLAFQSLLIIGTGLTLPLAAWGSVVAVHGTHDSERWFLIHLLCAGTLTVYSLAFAGLGMLLRSLLKNGIAARALALVALGVALIAPLFVGLILDPDSFDSLSRHVPPVLSLSPATPWFVAAAAWND